MLLLTANDMRIPTYLLGIEIMYHLTYVMRVLISTDQLINAITGGSPDETLSSRTYRRAVLDKTPLLFWKLFHRFVDGLFFWQIGHCYESYLVELQHLHSDKDFG
jgi:hypothetical protein